MRGDVAQETSGGLRVPDGYSVASAADSEAAATVHRFVTASPDQTLYHQPAYLAHALRHPRVNLRDIALVRRDGTPLFALPLHEPNYALRVETTSGVLFPPGASEQQARRSTRALQEILDCNDFLYRAIQSAQAPAYDDPARATLVASSLEGSGLRLESMYSRVLTLGRSDVAGCFELEGEGRSLRDMPTEALARYDQDARNQIRQARRNGVSAWGVVVRDAASRSSLYERFERIHRESWARTGLTPHSLDYLISLSAAVTEAGGTDVLVFATDSDGVDVAAVNCHVFRERALYWAGGSVHAGLRLRANPLVLHTAIELCDVAGARLFEIGRFRPRERSEKEVAITRYKAQFGGSLLRLTAFRQTASRRMQLRSLSSQARASISLRSQRARDQLGGRLRRPRGAV